MAFTCSLESSKRLRHNSRRTILVVAASSPAILVTPSSHASKRPVYQGNPKLTLEHHRPRLPVSVGLFSLLVVGTVYSVWPLRALAGIFIIELAIIAKK